MEQSFIGAPVEDIHDPIELGHVARSFDSCIVCTVHATTARLGRRWPGSRSTGCCDPGVDMTLVIGCGNLLRGDDAVGPLLVRRMLERGLPPGVEVADGGTSGMDVAFRMRGVGKVILVDAATTGGEPGTLYRLTGADVETLPPSRDQPACLPVDHALPSPGGPSRDEYPAEVEVYLIEAGSLEFGDRLTAEVEAAMDRLADALVRTGQPEPVS